MIQFISQPIILTKKIALLCFGFLLSATIFAQIEPIILTLEAPEHVNEGDVFTLDIKVDNFTDIAGFQFPLIFDNNAFQLESVEYAPELSLADGQIIHNTIFQGALFNWFAMEGELSLENGTKLFSLNFKLLDDRRLKSSFEIKPFGVPSQPNYLPIEFNQTDIQAIPYETAPHCMLMGEPVELSMEMPSYLSAGDIFTLDIKVKNFTDISNFQFPLVFDKSVFQFYELEGAADFPISNWEPFYNPNFSTGIMITWYGSYTSLDDGTTLFSIKLQVLEDAHVESCIKIAPSSNRIVEFNMLKYHDVPIVIEPICTSLNEPLYTTMDSYSFTELALIYCDADVEWSVDDFGIKSTCSALNVVTVSLQNEEGETVGAVDVLNGGIFEYLTLGTYTGTLLVVDACSNSLERPISLEVKDEMQPVAICEANLTVFLEDNNMATLTTLDMDAGSYDNCGDLILETRRVENSMDDDLWGNSVSFSAADLNKKVVVILRATDGNGNNTVCWLEVHVQKQGVLAVDCPDDLTLPYSPDLQATAFTEPTILDDSMLNISYVDEVNLDDCQQGTIERIWMDENGAAFCSQTLFVENVNAFIVQFPADEEIEVSHCDAPLVGFIKYPTLTNVDLEKISVTYNDLRNYKQEEGCYFILRTWTVINSCVYEAANPNNTKLGIALSDERLFQDDNDGFFQYKQFIKVVEKPSLQEAAVPISKAESPSVTQRTTLAQNQPNPFSNETTIQFYLAEASAASLKIYDLSGRIVQQIEGTYTKGQHEFSLDSQAWERSGILYYQLSTPKIRLTRKMMVIK